MVRLDDSQIEAVEKLQNGKILCGGTGTGKSRTSLAYYFFKVCGGQAPVNGEGTWEMMTAPRDLYIITTAKKRDSLEWERECLQFNLSTNPDNSMNGVKVVIDSWNNIKRYISINGAFFIFDEQRVVGSGAWVKAFYKITVKNRWILLSATPGDDWKDYIPVFVANRFYKNKSEFYERHCIFSRFAKYPKIEKYMNTRRLAALRDYLLVDIPYDKTTIPHHVYLDADYDKPLYLRVVKDRWDPFEDEPIIETGKLCYLMRKVVNADESRKRILRDLLRRHNKLIVFYNFTYELEILRKVAQRYHVPYSEWNGEKHEEIQKTSKWLYFVQYSAGSEGWNCIETDTILFYSQNYSYRSMVQAEGRIDRRNTPFTDLYYYHIVSKAPIDKAIKMALLRKENFNERKYLSQ